MDDAQRDDAAVVRETVALYSGGMDDAQRDDAAVVRETRFVQWWHGRRAER